MTTAARKAIEITALGVVPLLALVIGLTTFAGQDRLALDFHQELYPQAQAVVHGRDAYPPPDADLSDGTNAIWPMAAVLPVIPLTALPADAADWLVALFVLATLAAALWVLRCARLAGVRGHAALAAGDRRVPDRQRNAATASPHRADMAIQRQRLRRRGSRSASRSR